MRTWFVIVAAACQVLVLAYVAGQREYVVHAGRNILLRTAPVDPRDPFRGDFVRLRYDLSTIRRESLSEDLRTSYLKSGARIYVALREDDNGVAEIVQATAKRPADGLFIRGRVDQRWGWRGRAGTMRPLPLLAMRLRYGIEAYFVEQGKGLELERNRQRQGIQVPLLMGVALGSNGMAVLKDHRWAPLGIGIELATVSQDDPRPRRNVVVGATLRLMNASDEPLAIVDFPEGRSFRLVHAPGWARTDWTWVAAGAAPIPAKDKHVRVLAPGEVVETKIDLTRPEWAVRQGENEPKQIRQLERNDRFRLVYSPPDKEACRHLAEAALIWHGRLPSRAFGAGGRID